MRNLLETPGNVCESLRYGCTRPTQLSGDIHAAGILPFLSATSHISALESGLCVQNSSFPCQRNQINTFRAAGKTRTSAFGLIARSRRISKLLLYPESMNSAAFTGGRRSYSSFARGTRPQAIATFFTTTRTYRLLGQRYAPN
jgi:hypothetical protein